MRTVQYYTDERVKFISHIKSYFFSHSLIFTKCSATEDLLAAFLVAVVIISGSFFSINF